MDPVCEQPFNNQSLYAQNQSIWFTLTSVGLDLHSTHYPIWLSIQPKPYLILTHLLTCCSPYRFDSTSVNIPTYFTLSHSLQQTTHTKPTKIELNWSHTCNKKESNNWAEGREKQEVALAHWQQRQEAPQREANKQTKLDLEAASSDWVRAKCIQICACISVPSISSDDLFLLCHTSPSPSPIITPQSQIHLLTQPHYEHPYSEIWFDLFSLLLI